MSDFMGYESPSIEEMRRLLAKKRKAKQKKEKSEVDKLKKELEKVKKKNKELEQEIADNILIGETNK